MYLLAEVRSPRAVDPQSPTPIAFDPALLARPGQRLPRYATQAEVQRLFSVIESPRDRALFALLYQYGLRVGEVALLQRGDVDLQRRRIVVKHSKGGAWSAQPLFAATAELLAAYLGHRSNEPSFALFPGRRGTLRKRQLQALFRHHVAQANWRPHLTCHSLRHAIATHLLDAGPPLEFVQDHLGHQSIRSTSIYARITDRVARQHSFELRRHPVFRTPLH